MKKISKLDYVYALGKIRSLEKFLIKSSVFEEAVDSSLQEALRLFAESGILSSDFLHIQNSEQLEALLTKEVQNLKKVVKDLLLDKGLLRIIDMDNLADAYMACSDYGNQFLVDYMKHLVDLHNIKSFLRLYALKEPVKKLNEVLVYEGFIPKKMFIEYYTQDLNAFLNKLEYVPKHFDTIDYTYYLGEAMQKVLAERSFITLERAINDFLIQILKPAKLICFGPEPIVAHYFARLNEINLMRMIILAKLNALPTELIKERLNNVYA
jgi:V/A-type H+-transporting ATPase subunit C